LIGHLVDGDVVDSCFDVKQHGGQEKQNHVGDDSYTYQLWKTNSVVLISLDSTMEGKLSMNLIPPVILRNIFKNVTSYFPDGYTLRVDLQQNNINLFYEFMDISVL